MATKPWPPEAINNDHFWQYKAKAMLCDLEEALFPSISIQFIHPAIFEDPACSSQYRSDGRSKNLQDPKNRKHLEGKDVASGVLLISWGEGLPPYTHPGFDGPTTYQHCWTTTTRIHFSSLEDGWLDIWLSLNKARYSAVSHVLTINLLSTSKNIHELSLEELFQLDQ